MRNSTICFFLVLVTVGLSAGPALGRPDTNKSPANSTGRQSDSAKKVDVEEFDRLRQDKANVVLDVRTKKEFEAGHIPGALNLDISSSDFEKQIATLDTNKTYLVHCAAGIRSARACSKMSNMGFKQLIDLAPGFRAWEKAGKPVESGPAK